MKEWVLSRKYSTLKEKNDNSDQCQHHRSNNNYNCFSYYFNDNSNNYYNGAHNEHHYSIVFAEISCALLCMSSENKSS